MFARRLWKGRSIFSQATESGPAICEWFVHANKCTQQSAGPLGQNTRVLAQHSHQVGAHAANVPPRRVLGKSERWILIKGVENGPFNPFDTDTALNAAWARRAGAVSHLPRSTRVVGQRTACQVAVCMGGGVSFRGGAESRFSRTQPFPSRSRRAPSSSVITSCTATCSLRAARRAGG